MTNVDDMTEQVRCTAGLRVCLIRPPAVTTVTGVGQDAIPPLGLAYIAGTVRAAGFELTVIDAVGEAITQYTRSNAPHEVLLHGLTFEEIAARVEPDVEVIGVTCMFSSEWLTVRRLLDRIRERAPKALLVLGGEHVTSLPEFVLDDSPVTDVIVLGEGEETFRELLLAHAAGAALTGVNGLVYRDGASRKIVRTVPRARIREVDDIAPPAWRLFPVENYIEHAHGHGINLGRSFPMLASRGCPYRCSFCSSPLMWKAIWHVRRPGAVVAEMKAHIARYGVTNFDFYDLTAIVDREWLKRFCELLIAEKLDITWQLPSGTRSEGIDSETAPMLYRAGCRAISCAPETGSRRELDLMHKRISLRRMRASMVSAHKAGIQVKANFIVGFPGSGWRDVLATAWYVLGLAVVGINDIAAFPFSPYPGSKLFDELVTSGDVVVDDAYFAVLHAINDPASSFSYTESFSSRGLAATLFGIMLLFYATSFILRPGRLVRVVRSMATRTTESRLNVALATVQRKRCALRMMRESGTATVQTPRLYEPAKKKL